METNAGKRYETAMIAILYSKKRTAASRNDLLRAAATELFLLAPRLGVNPDKLIVVKAHGPTGGNPLTMPTANCYASFNDEAMAREWFAWAADDADFDKNVVA